MRATVKSKTSSFLGKMWGQGSVRDKPVRLGVAGVVRWPLMESASVNSVPTLYRVVVPLHHHRITHLRCQRPSPPLRVPMRHLRYRHCPVITVLLLGMPLQRPAHTMSSLQPIRHETPASLFPRCRDAVGRLPFRARSPEARLHRPCQTRVLRRGGALLKW